MITKRDAAIISAYTGFLLGDFQDLHEYVEELFGRPVWTHEFGYNAKQIKELSKPDFLILHDAIVGSTDV